MQFSFGVGASFRLASRVGVGCSSSPSYLPPAGWPSSRRFAACVGSLRPGSACLPRHVLSLLLPSYRVSHPLWNQLRYFLDPSYWTLSLEEKGDFVCWGSKSDEKRTCRAITKAAVTVSKKSLTLPEALGTDVSNVWVTKALSTQLREKSMPVVIKVLFITTLNTVVSRLLWLLWWNHLFRSVHALSSEID